ncbi:phosphotransferase [Terrabacter sp. BE26]|uniref:phosphotransferase n=1 Tax=Terrabacter sp. BE26 TaxID=2898152 RepID=UPI0035BE3DC6
MTDDEEVALYDPTGEVVGSAPRSVVRARNLGHAASSVVVRDPMGRVYLHRRTTTKDVYPGLLDFAAGGVVLAGEDPAVGAVREVEEELGVSGVPLEPRGVTHYADEHTDHVAVQFVTTWDGPIRWQPEEVSWGEWVTVEELVRRLDEEPATLVPDSRAVWSATVRSWAADQVPLEQGWDNVTTLVEGRWVDRVARRPEAESGLLAEVGLLTLLAEGLPLEVPRPVVLDQDPLRVRHTLLEGTAVDPLALTAADGRLFARFLTALHATPPALAAEARCPSASDDARHRIAGVARFRDVVLPALPAAVQRAGDSLLGRVATVREQALCHGDLVAEHVLGHHGHLSGVIGWGDARVTDPALDLAWALNATSGPFAQAVADGIRADGDVRARSRDWWALAPWFEVEHELEREVEGRGHGDADAHGEDLQRAHRVLVDRLLWWQGA